MRELAEDVKQRERARLGCIVLPSGGPGFSPAIWITFDLGFSP
jgi:hypothetical protein